ncbi:MAG TPA: DNA/RNA nuclease SfsA [archaeon]|nr:DNA/RNA nuclease SfsA [archaeon]
MRFDKPLLKGRLIRRYKRFLADITLAPGGETVTVHVPNSGSMLTVSDPGSEVILSDSRNPSRRFPLSLEMVRVADGEFGWAGVNTGLPNRFVEAALRVGKIPELSGYESLRREAGAEKGSRLDFLLEDRRRGQCWVEVKNVTLVQNRTAFFPDAVTLRGRKHLEVLERLVSHGARAVIFFLVQRPDCEILRPADHVDPEYGETLRRVIKKGVEVLAYRSSLSLEGAVLAGPVPFEAA